MAVTKSGLIKATPTSAGVNADFSGKTPAAVFGPYCVEATEVFSPGVVKAEVYSPGAAAQETYSPGAVKTQVNC